jgi:peptide deformylase
MSVTGRRLLLHPDPTLREKARPIVHFDEELRSIAADLERLMDEHEGVGMAGPQIGESVRIFVANSSEDGDETRVYVNPEIIKADGPLEWEDEGCLSLPGIQGSVRRPTHVQIKAFDVTGAPFEASSDGFLARIWQHENDHLDGILILDRMRPLDRLSNRRAVKTLLARSEGHARENS